MNTPNEHYSIRDTILGSIKSGKAHMRPKWYFILKTVLAAIGVFIFSIGIIYVASLAHFLLKQSGAWFAPSLGAHGIWILFISLPWILVAAAILFVVILELLVRRYSFAYRQPLMYSVIGVIGFATLATMVVAHTGMHDTIYQATQNGSLPAGVPIYKSSPFTETSEVHPGVITAITGEGSFALERVDGSVMSVELTSKTKMPKGYTPEKDDEVVVVGHSKKTNVAAWGIRPVNNRAFIPFNRPHKEKMDEQNEGVFTDDTNERISHDTPDDPVSKKKSDESLSTKSSQEDER